MSTLFMLVLGCLAATCAIVLYGLATAPRREPEVSGPPTGAVPGDLSPALASQIWNRSYGSPAMTAAVLNLQRQGFIKIEGPDAAGSFTLTRAMAGKPPFADEAQLLTALFAVRDTVRTGAESEGEKTDLRTARKEHAALIDAQYTPRYHLPFKGLRTLPIWTALAGLVLLMIDVAVSQQGHHKSPLPFAVVLFGPLLGASLGAAPRKIAEGPAVGAWIAALFAIGAFAVAGYFVPPTLVLIVAAFGAVPAIGYTWLPRPTPEGARARGVIAGLKTYFEQTTPSPADLGAGADAARDRFQTLRPYAVALGAGKQWNAYHGALLAGLGVATIAAAAYDSGGSVDLGSSDAFNDSFDTAFSDAFDSALSSAIDSSSDSSSSDGGGDSGGGGDGGGSTD